MASLFSHFLRGLSVSVIHFDCIEYSCHIKYKTKEEDIFHTILLKSQKK